MSDIVCGPDVLNAVWEKWNLEHNESNFSNNVWLRDYSRTSRRSFTARLFEEWLFTEGAMVMQKDHKRYLRFLDAEKAAFFLLRCT